jgi:hypothetical protein
MWLAVACLAFAAAPAAAREEWSPVDPALLTIKEPVVEKDADAEAVFWEVRVADEQSGSTVRTVLKHYVRVKIFTERGSESQSKVDIPYSGRYRIEAIAGRTIKPDGSIVELKPDAVFERTIVSFGRLKVKAKSFAMPAVEPGAVIEYRWREVRGDSLSMYEQLPFQRDIPVQLVKYYIKPLSLPGFPFGMRYQGFHLKNTPFTREPDGSYSTAMSNVPAFREEPRMPPEDQVRPWMLLYYSRDRKLEPEKFWIEHGKDLYGEFKPMMKVNDEVKRAAAEAAGDASSPDEKIARIFEFCRSKIKDVDDDASGLTAIDREKMKENKSPADTLKRGAGTGTDINMLFAALATAAGFDVRPIALSDRSRIFFDRGFPDPYFLGGMSIAVKIGEEWRFFDPASTHVPFGMLRWQEEGISALVLDPKAPVWVTTPISAPEKSTEKRTAQLRLAEDGALEGDVRVEYTGHFAADRKELDDDDTPEEREQRLRDALKARLGAVELSGVQIENPSGPLKPYVYAYHVKVPGYAQRTGKRLFLQPAFFQRGTSALFPTSARTHSIYFHYPWTESDQVDIELPEGYTLDNADAPAPVGAGEVSKYDVYMGITKDGKKLHYKRTFMFGGGGTIVFPQTSYTPLKQYFDAIHAADTHTITLKQGAAAK